VQAMRQSANWPAVLALLDGPDTGPTRALALRAIADRPESQVVDGVIARLSREPDTDRRRQYADALARVHKKPGPWAYWGCRPAPRPASRIVWERTEAIAAMLDRALADPDHTVRSAVLRRMLREKVTTRLTTLRRWLDDRPGPESVAAILEALRDHDAEERRDPLATIVADGSHTPANRLAALALWPGEDEGKGQARLLDLAAALEDGPVLAAAIRQITRPSLTQATPLLERELDSSDPSVRA